MTTYHNNDRIMIEKFGDDFMFKIRPVTDLRNNFSDISKEVHENQEPVFLTKNGYGDMVVMSMEQYGKIMEDSFIAKRLKASAAEAKETKKRFDFFETAEEMRKKLNEKV